MKKNIRFSVFLSLQFLSAIAQQPPGSAAIGNIAPAIDSLYRAYAQQIHCPGMVYGIIRDGELVHVGSMGYSNLEKKYPADEHAAFRIASMTKSFVSVAILQLRDQGRLHLDDPAYLYIPGLKEQKYLSADAAPFTIRNLLTHSAGFPEDNPWGDRQLDISDSEMLAMFRKGISFSTNPGTGYEYSNMGFAMLGYIIKKVSGQKYEEYISEHILKPLGMNHTYWEYSKVPDKELAIGYRYVNGQWIAQPMLHDGAYGAMGGLITTVDDFRKYLSFHLAASMPSDAAKPGPLKRSSVREIQKPWQFASLNAKAVNSEGNACAAVAAYGYGMRWSEDCKGRVLIGHSGGLPGFGSNWMISPAYGIGIVSFFNVTYAPATMINTHALDTIIKLAGLLPQPVAVSAILNQRKTEIMALLPSWEGAQSKDIFAENFFQDYFIDSLKKESKEMFANIGRVVKVGNVAAQNNLRGSFVIEGEKAALRIFFSLSPESPPRIQALEMEAVAKPI